MNKNKGKCKNKACKKEFIKRNPWQVVCGDPDCALALVEERKRKEEASRIRRERREDKAKLQAMKTLPQLKRELEAIFNSYIRLRDREKNCISCDTPLSIIAYSRGGRYDAGHYRSVGSADHLRFNEDNVHGQCKYCNKHLAGNHVNYRIGLINRISLERVEALENNNEVHHWTREELEEKIRVYRKKLKDLRKEINHGT